MAKKQKKPTAVAGDAFAVPLEGGQFAVCRVLKVRDRTDTMLVANSDWIGHQVPDAHDPALRSILRLTHHSWNGKPSAAWVSGAPPEDFIPIGNIPPEPGEVAITDPGAGGWPFFQVQPLAQWYCDHPEDVPPPPPPPDGRFILHRFNGDEVYRFETAVMWAYANDQGVTLWFELSADSDALQRCEDTAEMGMSPNAEVGINLPELDADQLVGREFLIPGTKSDEEDSCMSLLYYCEHEPLRQNRITVVSRAGDRFRLRWTAVTQDVNYYDGSKPLTKVEIEGEFLFKDIGKWGRAEPGAPPDRGGTRRNPGSRSPRRRGG
jgi:hypothetical protein